MPTMLGFKFTTDECFISQLRHGIVLRHGDYNDFLEATSAPSAPPPKPVARPAAKPAPAREKKPSQKARRDLGKLEDAIGRLELEQSELERQLGDPAAAGDLARIAELGEQHRRVQSELTRRLREWEQLGSQVV